MTFLAVLAGLALTALITGLSEWLFDQPSKTIQRIKKWFKKGKEIREK